MPGATIQNFPDWPVVPLVRCRGAPASGIIHVTIRILFPLLMLQHYSNQLLGSFHTGRDDYLIFSGDAHSAPRYSADSPPLSALSSTARRNQHHTPPAPSQPAAPPAIKPQRQRPPCPRTAPGSLFLSHWNRGKVTRRVSLHFTESTMVLLNIPSQPFR